MKTHAPHFPPEMDRSDKAKSLPRKVIVATLMDYCRGTLSERIAKTQANIDQAAEIAKTRFPSRGLDLLVLPENVFINECASNLASERAIPLQSPALKAMQAKAIEHNTNLVMTQIIADDDGHAYNSGIVIDRKGQVIGVYRKVFPVCHPDGSLEMGITPGSDFPVFECDFGKIGVQICWDMSYVDGFVALARQGAEIVCIPTASPQTVRPAAYALFGRYYVVTSTRRDNATIFNPAGQVVAQTTDDKLLVAEIDLSYALAHWTRKLEDGQALQRQFGDRVGFNYSAREDTGVFWSNDPNLSIDAMFRQLDILQLPEHLARSRVGQCK